jgi:hypothetical protein
MIIFGGDDSLITMNAVMGLHECSVASGIASIMFSAVCCCLGIFVIFMTFEILHRNVKVAGRGFDFIHISDWSDCCSIVFES